MSIMEGGEIPEKFCLCNKVPFSSFCKPENIPTLISYQKIKLENPYWCSTNRYNISMYLCTSSSAIT